MLRFNGKMGIRFPHISWGASTRFSRIFFRSRSTEPYLSYVLNDCRSDGEKTRLDDKSLRKTVTEDQKQLNLVATGSVGNSPGSTPLRSAVMKVAKTGNLYIGGGTGTDLREITQ